MRRQLVYVVGIVAVAVAVVVYTVVAGNEPLLGLDLQGGASVVLEPTRAAEPDELDVAVEIIRNRVDGLGVAEPEISTQGGNILVQLPGVDEQQRALDLVGQTAELRFRPVLSSLSESALEGADSEDPLLASFALTEGEAAADAEVVLPLYDDDRNIVARYRLGPTAVAGDSLEGAVAQYNALAGIGWFVAPTFKPGPAGIDLFNEVSLRCHSRLPSCPTGQVAIELDNEVVSAPVVQGDSAFFAPFERSGITISGGFSEEEARDVALVLDYGALPVELEAQQSPDRVGVAGNRRPLRRCPRGAHRAGAGIGVPDRVLPPAGPGGNRQPGPVGGDAVDDHRLAGRVAGACADPGWCHRPHRGHRRVGRLQRRLLRAPQGGRTLGPDIALGG